MQLKHWAREMPQLHECQGGQQQGGPCTPANIPQRGDTQRCHGHLLTLLSSCSLVCCVHRQGLEDILTFIAKLNHPYGDPHPPPEPSYLLALLSFGMGFQDAKTEV